MTEEEVLAVCAEQGLSEFGGNLLFGEGDDREMWTVHGNRAFLRYPSPRQQRLERAPTQWEIDERDKRGRRTEVVYDGSPDLPDRLAGAIAWVQERLDSIPAKLRAKARVSFDTSYSYGESYANIKITYERPETDEEWDQRKAELAERIEHHSNLRRQKYERMKAEFEATPAPADQREVTATDRG